MRRFAVSAAVLGLLSTLAFAPPARAEGPEIRRHGEACPPTGCAGRRGSSATASLGFGLAVLATGLIARRGAARPR
jgi:hypothetical protein